MPEKIIETRTCTKCQIPFDITDRDKEFYDKVSPIFAGQKCAIPAPTLCPECRRQRRILFRNHRKLYHRKSDLSGKDIISIFSPDKPYTVYNQKERWSDEYDPYQYGRDFDFSRPFFDQFEELLKDVPHIGTVITNAENCDYNVFCVDSKNCFLSQRVAESEDIAYSYLVINKCKDCVDCLHILTCEHCYELIDCDNCVQSLYSQNCSTCYNIAFCYECHGCNNCIGCISLNNKSYCIFNQQYSKEEYEQRSKEFDYSASGVATLHKLFQEKKNTSIHKENANSRVEHVLGDRIVNSKDIMYGFEVDDVETGKYIFGCHTGKDMMDADFSYVGDKVYEHMSTSHGNSVGFSVISNESSHIWYSLYSANSHNLFGCACMRDGSYAILNKKYSKDEYEEMVLKIIEHMKTTGEWGQFFPAKLSTFGYNETAAMEYYPLTKDEAMKKGFKRSDYQTPAPKADKIVKAKDLPNTIEEVTDDVLNRAIECEISGNLFKIIKPELEFYRRYKIALPRRHQDVRHMDRMARRNPMKLWDRTCNKCGIAIKTSYAPERPEIVYCEDCYNKEIYG